MLATLCMSPAGSALSKHTQRSSFIILERARDVLPGGVNSPVRAFRGVEGEPVFIAEGQGAYLNRCRRSIATSITSALGGR